MCELYKYVGLVMVVSLSQVPPHHHHTEEEAAHLVESLAGSGQMLAQSLAAGLGQNSQWFQPAGAGAGAGASDSACEEEASAASLQPGWPSAGDLEDMTGGICWRRRRLLRGGSWGRWRYVRGTLRQTFLPNFLSGETPVVPAEIIVDTK